VVAALVPAAPVVAATVVETAVLVVSPQAARINAASKDSRINGMNLAVVFSRQKLLLST